MTNGQEQKLNVEKATQGVEEYTYLGQKISVQHTKPTKKKPEIDYEWDELAFVSIFIS